MKIVNTLKVHQINNEDVPASQKLDIYVKSHWDEESGLITIDVKGIGYGVKLSDLLTSVLNVKRSSI